MTGWPVSWPPTETRTHSPSLGTWIRKLRTFFERRRIEAMPDVLKKSPAGFVVLCSGFVPQRSARQPQWGGIRQPRAPALGRCRKRAKSPNGARFAEAKVVRQTGNRAPLGLTRDFVAKDQQEQYRRTFSPPIRGENRLRFRTSDDACISSSRISGSPTRQRGNTWALDVRA